MLEELQKIYSYSTAQVRTSNLSEEAARGTYAQYLGFVTQSSPNRGKLLDIGCGSGWSAYLLSKEGYEVIGVDLNADAFETPSSSNLTLIEGSVTSLPFPDSSFDVISSYQMLEHVPEPEKALLEIIRVLKPGGILCILGPNLLSIGHFIQSITKYVWKNRPIASIFWRIDNMPKHPWGNTLPEVLAAFPLKISLILKKTLDPKVKFTMREPDMIPPFHADNDACYLLNPIDLAKFLPSQNCTIMQNGLYGRPAWTRLIASGTFIAARKKN